MPAQSLRPLLTVGLLASLGGCAAPLTDETNEEAPLDTADFAEKAGTLSCVARRDTGYESGRAFSIDVVTVDGKPVERETAEAYWKMQQAAAREGVYVRIISGFRTQGEQRHLYGCYVRCDCNNCNLAAAPGYSNHQSGYALDLNTHESGVYTWLARNGARFGFARTVPSEDWHWEYMGGGAGGAWPCDGGGNAAPGAGGSNGAGGRYTVGWGGSCWDASQALGCSTGALVNCTSAGRDCDTLWAGDALACGAAACQSGGGAPAPAPDCRSYTVPPDGTCLGASQALGCDAGELRNTSGPRSCAGLWAGDVLTCGCTPSGAAGGGGAAPGGGATRTYRVPQGGSCEVAGRALGCSAGSLYNCTSPESGCSELWAGDTLACRAADCR
jgi:D-alanyl-D-alanine carboxypeptidase